MPLKMELKIDEGIIITDKLGNENKKPVSIVLRDISFDVYGRYALFEMIDNGTRDYFALSRHERRRFSPDINLLLRMLPDENRSYIALYLPRHVKVERINSHSID